jgi:hypothetical protein
MFVKYFEVSDFAFGHKCEENGDKQGFSLCCDISESGKSVKGEMFSKTSG